MGLCSTVNNFSEPIELIVWLWWEVHGIYFFVTAIYISIAGLRACCCFACCLFSISSNLQKLTSTGFTGNSHQLVVDASHSYIRTVARLSHRFSDLSFSSKMGSRSSLLGMLCSRLRSFFDGMAAEKRHNIKWPIFWRQSQSNISQRNLSGSEVVVKYYWQISWYCRMLCWWNLQLVLMVVRFMLPWLKAVELTQAGFVVN
jgi:hypothetical protein